MKFAVIYAPTTIHGLLPYFAALATLVLAAYGVKVVLDWQDENLYIETAPRFCPRALRSALRLIDRLGLEVLDEDEHVPLTTYDGGVRIYLAQRQ